MHTIIITNATAGCPVGIERDCSGFGRHRHTGGGCAWVQDEDPSAVVASSASPELMATIRVYGSILYATNKWTATEVGRKLRPLERHDIDTWMEDCAAAGVTTILMAPSAAEFEYN